VREQEDFPFSAGRMVEATRFEYWEFENMKQIFYYLENTQSNKLTMTYLTSKLFGGWVMNSLVRDRTRRGRRYIMPRRSRPIGINLGSTITTAVLPLLEKAESNRDIRNYKYNEMNVRWAVLNH
jgi:hypothetical protein